MSDRCEPPEEFRWREGLHWIVNHLGVQEIQVWSGLSWWSCGFKPERGVRVHEWRYLCPVPTPAEIAAKDAKIARQKHEIASLRLTLGGKTFSADVPEPIGCPIPGACVTVAEIERLRKERDHWQQDSIEQAKAINRLAKAAEDRNKVDASREQWHAEQLAASAAREAALVRTLKVYVAEQCEGFCSCNEDWFGDCAGCAARHALNEHAPGWRDPT